MKELRTALAGFAAGITNGLLGAGGGMIVVPMLKKSGLSTACSHATSIAVIFPICAVSTALYFFQGNLEFQAALPYLPGTLAGSFLGAKLLPRLNETVLRRLFALLMLWAAWRMLFPS